MEDPMEDIEKEKLSKLMENMKNLYSLWDQIGVEKQKMSSRCETAWDFILELSKDIYNEDYSTYNSLLQRIQAFSEEVADLSKQLLVPSEEEIEGTLLYKEEMLRKKLSELKEMKEIRIKKFQEFRSIELKYCAILDWQPLEISSKTGVPSERDISEIELHISELQKERDKRLQRFLTAKRELTTILEMTEIQPETPFEKKILSSNEEELALTNETFETLDQVVNKVRKKQASLEHEKKMLLEKLTNLWERLQIPEKEKNEFLSAHKDYKMSTLKSIKDEIEKYEELKRQNLEIYICALREELSSLWKECFVSDEEKEAFLCFKSDEYTEENLQAHEVEVEKWRMLYIKIEKISKKILKRNKLWDLLIVFENKAQDPNRFKNRRGNLLKEEKERKKLGEDLPALENEIFLDIENFEAENGIPFRYYGESYRTFVMKQWEERRIQKENEKIMRHNRHMLQGENEAALCTPRMKRTLCAAPRSAPCKFLKSSLGVAVYRTPLGSTTRNSPRTVGKKSINTKPSSVKNRLAFSTERRAVLKENAQNSAIASADDKLTYSVFSSSMNKSSRSPFRSSVLPSKKKVGTRISKKNKQSTSKSLRKSARNISAKGTPGRGNLGLPVLI